MSEILIPPSPAKDNRCPERGIFISASVESLLSKASGNKNGGAKRRYLLSFSFPFKGWPQANPSLSVEIDYFRFEENKKARKYSVCGLSCFQASPQILHFMYI